MRGKKAKMLRANALDVMTSTTDERTAYRQLKKIYSSWALKRAQKPKATKERSRRHPDPIAPTWPATANQRAQSRPLIVMGNQVARIVARVLDEETSISAVTGGRCTYYKQLGNTLTKSQLDHVALGVNLV